MIPATVFSKTVYASGTRQASAAIPDALAGFRLVIDRSTVDPLAFLQIGVELSLDGGNAWKFITGGGFPGSDADYDAKLTQAGKPIEAGMIVGLPMVSGRSIRVTFSTNRPSNVSVVAELLDSAELAAAYAAHGFR